MHQLKVMKNEHPRSSLEQDDTDSSNYEALQQLIYVPTPNGRQNCVLALSQTKWFE